MIAQVPLTLQVRVAVTADEWDATDESSKRHFGASRKPVKISAHRRDRRQARVAIRLGAWD